MLLEKLAAIIPRWMITAPRDHYERLMSGPAALQDALGEAVYQARYAALPGQTRLNNVPALNGFDSIGALFLVARDRLVMPAQISGLPWVTEKPWQLAYRLRNWRDDWVNNVGAFGLLDQIAAVLVPDTPVLRFVCEGGGIASWYTREADGTRRLQRSDGNGWAQTPDGTLTADTTAAQIWNWDASSLPPPPDQFDYSRGWLIAYVPAGSPYLTATDGTFNDPGVVDDAWNDPAAQVKDQPIAGTVGTNAPAGFVSLIVNVVLQRRTAGLKIPWLIVAFDPASFNPDGSSTAGASRSAYPDGEWAWHSTPGVVGGVATRVVARLQTAEYWRITDNVPAP